MSLGHKLLAGGAAVVVTCAAGLATSGTASADPPAQPIPIDVAQAPGLPAMQELSPILQQAAANPQNAVSMLMAAASAFAGNSSVPADSRQVATSVNHFVQTPGQPVAAPGPLPLPNNLNMPTDLAQLLPPGLKLPIPDAAAPGAVPPQAAPHIPAIGVTPGTEPHLPTGIDPANAVGPAPGEAPAPAPGAAPDSTPLAAAAPPAAPAAPAPEAAPPAPAPDASAPAPAPAPGGPAPAPAASALGPDAPPTQEFMYPSIGNACLADGGNVIATAISVAGPASIPKPGPSAGQTAYVFTALGTPAPAAEQKLPLNVTWVNLTTGKSGGATLKPNPEINPNGPTTLMAIADTGSGSIISTIFGQVTTTDRQCTFMPTIGSTVVP